MRAGLCLLSITLKLLKGEKLIVLKSAKNAERIYSRRFDVRNALLQSFNLTVKKRFKKKKRKRGEKV